MQLAVEPSVFNRRRDLTGDGSQQRQILAVEWFVGLFAAQREHGDRAALEHAGHEIVEAGIAPELDLLRNEPCGGNRIVQRHRPTAIEPRDQRGRTRQRRHRTGESIRANRREVAGGVFVPRRQQQRHALDDERLDDAGDQPLAEADDVEVRVQVARERDQRAPVVVPVAVEHPVERVLHRLLDRLRQQDDYHRRQQRDDARVLIGISTKHERGELEHREVEQHRRRQKRGEGKPAFDDHFNVAQPIPDDGRREGQRHEAERNRGELKRRRRIDAQRPRQRVAKRIGSGAERRAPCDPAQLALSRHRSNLAERTREHRYRSNGADEHVHRLRPIERLERAENIGPDDVPCAPREIATTRPTASRIAGTYINGINHASPRTRPAPPRSGNTSVKWSSKGGSSATKTASAQ